jgi:disulfide bond formation protein DsbB
VINGSGNVSGGGAGSINTNINFTLVAGILLVGGTLLGLYVALRQNHQHAPAENVSVSPSFSWFSSWRK